MNQIQSGKELPQASDEEVMNVIRTEPRPGFGLPLMAIDELQYRFYKKMQEATARLLSASNALTDATNNVHQEIMLVKDSSRHLEKLTSTLRNLTWALILLTVLAAVVPIGIEIWKAYHEPQNVHVSAPLEPWQ
jgi:hypothetical protein